MREAFPNRLDSLLIRHLGDQIKSRVEELLRDETLDWANGSASFFDMPRGDKLVRPICYLDVDVRLAYQALVDAVAKVVEPYIEAEFGDWVLSHRMRSEASELMFRDSPDAHSRFIEIQHQHADARTFSHCVKLDVSNYYERIYHHKLSQLLQRLGVPGSVSPALMTLLRKFSDGVSYGIPQGLWPSDYLGNIYLLYLDEFLKNRGIYAIRYVDDYRIFCSSVREGRSILKACSGVLRTLGLNPQPLKTSIVEIEKLNPELKPLTEQFLDLRKGKIKVLVRQLGTDYFGEEVITESEEWEEQDHEAPMTEEDIKAFERLWTEAVDQEEKRTSVVRFALAGLSLGASPTAEEYVLTTLADFPHLASVASRYLASLGFKDSTANRILDFLESEDNIQEWQEMWLLDYFRIDGSSLGSNKSRIMSILEDTRRHPLVRALAAEILALHGTASDGEDIRRLFTTESHPRLRRALLSGFRLLPAGERNHAISYLPPTDWNLRVVGQLVKGGALG
ncbi:MAG: RNA-directed DNA polymerase [Dehalococcoidia bacterium]